MSLNIVNCDTILAPSPDALRKMLAQCEAYAVSHDIRFNVSRTQLICFRCSPCADQSQFLFCSHLLPQSDSILHLGNTFNFNLSDKPDIQAKVMAFLRKANFVLFRFKSSDPHVKMKLFQAYCLSIFWQFSMEVRLSWAQLPQCCL